MVNTTACISSQMYKAFLPAMIAGNHGHLVSIASSAGLIGVNGLAGRCSQSHKTNISLRRKCIFHITFVLLILTDYCASKFAAVGFAESMALELLAMGCDGVKTTIVCPFFINTGMFDGAKTK